MSFVFVFLCVFYHYFHMVTFIYYLIYLRVYLFDFYELSVFSLSAKSKLVMLMRNIFFWHKNLSGIGEMIFCPTQKTFKAHCTFKTHQKSPLFHLSHLPQFISQKYYVMHSRCFPIAFYMCYHSLVWKMWILCHESSKHFFYDVNAALKEISTLGEIRYTKIFATQTFHIPNFLFFFCMPIWKLFNFLKIMKLLYSTVFFL